RLLKAIETGRADAILTWAINRLTRNPIDSGRLSWLLQNGTLSVIQTPEKQYLPSDNVLIFSVETGTANQYIIDLKKNVKRGTETKLSKGWSPHRAPEGYFNNLYEHTIEADGERFELIQRAWRLLIAGTHTIHEVIRVLNEDWGYTTRQRHKSGGGALSRTSAYSLFRNPFYAGYFKHGGQLYKGSHPAMITLTEFEAVQGRLGGQLGKPHAHERHIFAYAGLLTCARCKKSVVAERQTGRWKRYDYIYYRCGNRNCGAAQITDDGEKPPRRSLREDMLEREIDACLSRIVITPEVKEIVTEALQKWVHQEFGEIESIYKTQARSLVEGEKMLSELVEMRLRGLIDDALFTNKQRELKGNVSHLRLELGRIQERLDVTRETLTAALDFRLTARTEFLTGSTERRREIARSLGISFTVDPENLAVVIEVNPLLNYMIGQEPSLATGDIGLEMGDIASENGVLEPLKIGSGSQKRTAPEGAILVGWPSGTVTETLFGIFQSVWDGKCGFTRPTWLIAH
ncbi:recombinase family protein, partial [Armatimonas sp.]|uniref:recombinase family protein n=1 Tax=Armatimonas sp. TaxID=1872638 RepID=UPI003752224C